MYNIFTIENFTLTLSVFRVLKAAGHQLRDVVYVEFIIIFRPFSFYLLLLLIQVCRTLWTKKSIKTPKNR